MQRRSSRRGSAYSLLSTCRLLLSHTVTVQRVWECVREAGSIRLKRAQSEAVHCTLPLPAVWASVCGLLAWLTSCVGSIGLFPDPPPPLLDLVAFSFFTTGPPLPPFLPHAEGASRRPHDEGGGPPEPSPFLYVRRDSGASTSAPGRTETHPQCLLRGL